MEHLWTLNTESTLFRTSQKIGNSNERDRALTTKQLNSEGLYPDIFLMRADEDYRSDDLVKKDLLEEMIKLGFNPILAVDDRNQVVEMWRANDIPCFQCVEDGNF